MTEWTYIIAGAADTLPPDGKMVLLSIVDPANNSTSMIIGRYYHREISGGYYEDDLGTDVDWGVPYAWMNRPDAPPYPGTATPAAPVQGPGG